MQVQQQSLCEVRGGGEVREGQVCCSSLPLAMQTPGVLRNRAQINQNVNLINKNKIVLKVNNQLVTRVLFLRNFIKLEIHHQNF